jgi:ABC-type spermidine/putrescine transport system permease subunit II
MRAAFLALNAAILVFLLAPVVLVLCFALNPEPFIAFPPTGISLRWFVKFATSRDWVPRRSPSPAWPAPRRRWRWCAATCRGGGR